MSEKEQLEAAIRTLELIRKYARENLPMKLIETSADNALYNLLQREYKP